MDKLDSHQLWSDIVRAAEALGEELGGSLRIPLFVWLQEHEKFSLRKQVAGFSGTAFALARLRGRHLPQAPMAGKALFCLPHRTPSNVQNLLPVAREAMQRGMLGGIVTAGEYADETREFLGEVPVVTGREILSSLGFRRNIGIAAQALRAYHQQSQALEHRAPHAARRFRRNPAVYLREIVTSFQFAGGFRELLTAWGPSCVVSSSDMWPLEYQFAYQAKKLGIPSLVVQHGIVGHHWYPFVADRYLVWGDLFAQQMAGYGASRDRLELCGMPASDGLFQARLASAPASHRSWDEPTCVILSHTHGRSGNSEGFRLFGELVAATVRRTPRFRWRIKLHPSEDASFYQQLGPNVYGCMQVLPKTTTLEQAVAESDVVMTLFSTAGLEAMILGRPVIVTDVTAKVRELAWWPLYGGGVFASTPERLEAAIRTLAGDEAQRMVQLNQQRTFLERAFAHRGRAAASVVDVVARCSLVPHLAMA